MSTTDGDSLPDGLVEERKRSPRVVVVAVVVVAILIVGAVSWLAVQRGSNEEPAPNGYTTHTRVIIDGNEAFTHANGVVRGNGTGSNPYIIEGWYINTSSGGGISITDTTAPFVVKSCFVHGDYLNEHIAYSGIFLMNCANGRLVNNTCSNNVFGIGLSLSSNITLEGNNCSSNSWHGQGSGISLAGSSNNILNDNKCVSNAVDGIALESSNNNTLVGNWCSRNSGGLNYSGGTNRSAGIHLQSSSDNSLTRNNCSLNWAGYGIWLESSRNNALTDNNCSYDEFGGIFLFDHYPQLADSGHNTLHNNKCYACISYGILVDSNYNTLTNNSCLDGGIGIFVDGSWRNTLDGNNCSNNDDVGIALSVSTWTILTSNKCLRNHIGINLQRSYSNNVLMKNIISSNAADGIRVESSDETSMTSNYLVGNLQYGINVTSDSNSSLIRGNAFIDNNGAGASYNLSHVQAHDDGTGNSWDNTTLGGNYWSDWTTPDANHDGIVDHPYNITGTAGAQDHYPLTTSPVPIP